MRWNTISSGAVQTIRVHGAFDILSRWSTQCTHLHTARFTALSIPRQKRCFFTFPKVAFSPKCTSRWVTCASSTTSRADFATGTSRSSWNPLKWVCATGLVNRPSTSVNFFAGAESCDAATSPARKGTCGHAGRPRRPRIGARASVSKWRAAQSSGSCSGLLLISGIRRPAQS